VELVPMAGAEVPTARPSVEALAGAVEVLPQPSRKRKRGFSNLR
jgi:hypothetical protein